MSLRSPLGRVLGQGSAGGSHHWWAQRVGSIALVPLCVWLAMGIFHLPNLSYGAVQAWVAHPVHAVLLLITIAVLAHHSYLGVQVVIEDYVHTKSRKVATMLLVQFLHVLAAGAALFAVLRVSLGGIAPGVAP